MLHDDIKSKVNKLFSIYVTENNKEKCIDELFVLVYFHPRSFSITMKEEILNDFRSTLYPNVIENIFSKYNKEKSSFFTFVCLCLKNQTKVFLRKLYLKNAIDETILKEIASNENINTTDEESFQDIEKDFNKYNYNTRYREDDMKKKLSTWLLHTKSLKSKKNYKKAIFILSCKIAYIFDEKMIKTIAEYIEMPEILLRYYISKVNLKYATSSNAKKILEVKSQRDKYFVRKNMAQNLLNKESLSESGKKMLKCSKEYSIQKYQKACKKLETEKQRISNRTIAQITGISRSMIDRTLINITNILKYRPKDK